MEKYNIENLIEGYNQYIQVKPGSEYQDYIQECKANLKNEHSSIIEKQRQIRIICETNDGLQDISAARKQIHEITKLNGKLDQLDRSDEDLAKSVKSNFIDSSQTFLKKSLFLAHYQNLQKLPNQILKYLQAKDIASANQLLISFSKLFIKLQGNLNIDLFSNSQIVDVANVIISAFDFGAGVDPYEFGLIFQIDIIEASYFATIFLMNYDYLYNLSPLYSTKPLGKRDPRDDFDCFLFSLLQKVLNSNNNQDKRNLLSDEIKTFHLCFIILNHINKIKDMDKYQLIQNDLYLYAKAKLEKYESEIFETFYCVKNYSFSGRFFNAEIDILKKTQEDMIKQTAEVKNYRLFTIIFNIQMEKFIESKCTNRPNQNDHPPTFILINENETTTNLAKDISTFLIYHFSHQPVQPDRMLDIFLCVINTCLKPYYEYCFSQALNETNNIADRPALFLTEIKQIVLPYICSTWSNSLAEEIKQPIFTDLIRKMDKIISDLCNKGNDESFSDQKYEKIRGYINNYLDKKNIYTELKESIIKSTVAQILQEILEIEKYSTKDENKSLLLKRYKSFITDAKNINSKNQKICEWIIEKIDSIK